MLYRKLGKSGLNVSVLGFGCMRLPIQGGSKSHLDGFNPKKLIDEDKAARMVEYAINQGVNYFDTAYVYHAGKSETFLGKVLKGHRDRITLVTKLPVLFVQKQEDFDRIINEQLKRLDTDHLDVYLLHGLNRVFWDKAKKLKILEFLDRIRKDGLARHVGFSFHDDLKIFKEIVDSYDWAMCQIQYNYFDEESQAGRRGLTYAASKGLGVVIMEPIRGGKLADPVPAEVQALWDTAEKKRTPAEWALRWVWNHHEVSAVLSGMSEMSQVEENVRIANDGTPNSLSKEELSLIGRVKATYKKMLKVACTGCGYCMPCENGVNIPINFSAYNDLFMFADPEFNYMLYNRMLPPDGRASNCKECGKCEEKCPQHIPIREELKKVHQTLSEKKTPLRKRPGY